MASEALIVLDDFGINLTMTRTQARAPMGERVKVTAPFKPESNLSVLSALGVQGSGAPMTLAGAVNSEVFALYGKHLLVPCLRSGHSVLLDNVKFHYSPKAIELIEATGASVVPLPAYSPALNPLEEGIR